MQPARRRREAPVLDHFKEGAQLVEVQAAHQSFPYQNDTNNKFALPWWMLQVTPSRLLWL
jgi:hypothetical protein